jgi:hypothetical protein
MRLPRNVSKMKKVRINFTIAEEIKNFLDDEALKNGVTLSAYITMLIQQTRRQDKVMDTLTDVIQKFNEADTKKAIKK